MSPSLSLKHSFGTMNSNRTTQMNDSELVSSWTHIFSQQSTTLSSELVVFWLIFVVALLILALKAVKCILKWKNKKLDNKEVIHRLTTVLSSMIEVLSAKQTESPELLKVVSEIV